ncbi:MAG TPA: hypothetical protein VLI54_07165 [Bacillota bacterium]|nr:hypothetical protein [Bacillota bacterium]
MAAPAALTAENFLALHQRLAEVDADISPIHAYLGQAVLIGNGIYEPTPVQVTDIVVGCTYYPIVGEHQNLAPHRIVFGEYTIGTPNFSLLFSEVRFEEDTLILSQGRSRRWPDREHVSDWFVHKIINGTFVRNVTTKGLVTANFSRLSSLAKKAIEQRTQQPS